MTATPSPSGQEKNAKCKVCNGTGIPGTLTCECSRPQWSDTENSTYCDECKLMECIWCHDFTAETPHEVEEHATTCSDAPSPSDTEEEK